MLILHALSRFLIRQKKVKFGAEIGMLPKLKPTFASQEFMAGQTLAVNILFQTFEFFFGDVPFGISFFQDIQGCLFRLFSRFT